MLNKYTLQNLVFLVFVFSSVSAENRRPGELLKKVSDRGVPPIPDPRDQLVDTEHQIPTSFGPVNYSVFLYWAKFYDDLPLKKLSELRQFLKDPDPITRYLAGMIVLTNCGIDSGGEIAEGVALSDIASGLKSTECKIIVAVIDSHLMLRIKRLERH